MACNRTRDVSRGALILGLLALLQSTGCSRKEEGAAQPPKAAEQAPAAESRAPAKPTGPTKTLTLVASEGTPEELKRTVSILNERLRLAEIPGEARLEGERKIHVTLQDDPAMFTRAAELLLAGGELMFHALVTDQQMKPDEIEKRIAEIRAAKEAGTFDAKSPYNAFKWKDKDKWDLVENPGVPGYLQSEARATTDSEGKPAIWFSMTEAGSADYLAFTTKYVGRQEASVFDGEIVLAPTILEPIRGNGIITGEFTAQEAADTATILKSGKLPVDLNLEAE